jgi:hypothetical protein
MNFIKINPLPLEGKLWPKQENPARDQPSSEPEARIPEAPFQIKDPNPGGEARSACHGLQYGHAPAA